MSYSLNTIQLALQELNYSLGNKADKIPALQDILSDLNLALSGEKTIASGYTTRALLASLSCEEQKEFALLALYFYVDYLKKSGAIEALAHVSAEAKTAQLISDALQKEEQSKKANLASNVNQFKHSQTKDLTYLIAYAKHLKDCALNNYEQATQTLFLFEVKDAQREQQVLNDVLKIKYKYYQDATMQSSSNNLVILLALYMANWFLDKYLTFRLMSFAEKFIVILTVLFMFVCGMTTGGFILEQLGDGEKWQIAMSVLGAIASGNAQKSIFLAPLQHLVVLFFTVTQGETATGFVLIGLTFLSAACTFMINYGLGSFGAELFMIAVLGVSGPPGWVALVFALFFALMNALLVLSGTLADIKDRDKSQGFFAMIGKAFGKRWILSTFAILIALTGLLMTFYSGADEVAQKFGGIAIACVLLIGALWTEACYAYRKLMDTASTKQMPEWTIGAVWDKLCIILNATTVGFMAAEGGERFAGACGLEETTPAGESPNGEPSEPIAQSGAEEAGITTIKIAAGVLGATVSYAYTSTSESDEKSKATKNTLIHGLKYDTEKVLSNQVLTTYRLSA